MDYLTTATDIHFFGSAANNFDVIHMFGGNTAKLTAAFIAFPRLTLAIDENFVFSRSETSPVVRASTKLHSDVDAWNTIDHVTDVDW